MGRLVGEVLAVEHLQDRVAGVRTGLAEVRTDQVLEVVGAKDQVSPEEM